MDFQEHTAVVVEEEEEEEEENKKERGGSIYLTDLGLIVRGNLP